MKTKDIILAILFIEIQILLVFAWMNYQKVNELDAKVKRTNIFLHELYQDKGISSLERVDDYDVVIGNPDAPQSIVMYTRDGCSACEDFEMNAFPQLNENYIKTGKVKFILRKLYYPNDSVGGDMNKYAHFLSKEGKGQYDDEILSFYMTGNQDANQVPQMVGDLFPEDEKLIEYLSDADILNNFRVKIQMARKNGITKTPTFLINGQKLIGARKFSKFEELLSIQ